MILINTAGQIKEAPSGNWNFYVLFLGWLVPLYRRDWKWVFLGMILNGIFQLIGVNFYNFWYIKGLLMKGYKIQSLPSSITAETLSKKLKIDISPFMLAELPN